MDHREAEAVGEDVGGVMGWTDERVAEARAMWESKLYTASQIGERLGVSKNVILGKMHRMGLGRTCAAEISLAHSKNVLAIAERRRERAAKQLYRTKQAVLYAARSLAERRAHSAAAGQADIERVELRLVTNPGFVTRVEKAVDVYAHMKTDRAYHDALAALSR